VLLGFVRKLYQRVFCARRDSLLASPLLPHQSKLQTFLWSNIVQTRRHALVEKNISVMNLHQTGLNHMPEKRKITYVVVIRQFHLHPVNFTRTTSWSTGLLAIHKQYGPPRVCQTQTYQSCMTNLEEPSFLEYMLYFCLSRTRPRYKFEFAQRWPLV
jgi:hypothetical protein